MTGHIYPATPYLRRMTPANGWRGELIRDRHGEPVAMVVVRIGPTWTDAVAIEGEDRCVALRCRTNEDRLIVPTELPGACGTVWCRDGRSDGDNPGAGQPGRPGVNYRGAELLRRGGRLVTTYPIIVRRACLIASVWVSRHGSALYNRWLEGRLYDVLNNAIAAEVMNKGRPGDDSLAPQDRGVLERYVEPIMAALRACGASPDTADQRPSPPKGRKKKVYKESVKDLIDAGLLKADTRLVPLRKGLTQTALVRPDGNLEIGEQIFTAVSPAAMAVSGKQAEPGWDFWGAPSGEGGYIPLSKLRDRVREDGGKATDGGGSTPAPAVPAPAELPPLAFTENAAEHAAPAASLGTETVGSKKARQFNETVLDLLDAGLLRPGDELRSVRKALSDARAKLRPDGRLEVNGEAHGSLSAAAVTVSGNKAEPGWEFWAVERDGKLVSLYKLRDELRESRAGG